MDKFIIKTLVDVTQTHARRGEDTTKIHQQANFMTLYQVIGLRTNPVDFVIKKIETDLKQFGSNYKDIECYWQVEFAVEHVDSLTVDMMLTDFDLVPFISGLEECTTFKESVFYTKDKRKCNIIFSKVDK